MMLGYDCRCTSFNESGTPFSVDSSGFTPIDYSQVSPSCLDGQCTDGVAPRRYRLSYNFTPPASPYPLTCESLYQGEFVLHFNNTLPYLCFWQSTEYALKRDQAVSCGLDTATARFTFGMYSSPILVPSSCNYNHRYALTIYASYRQGTGAYTQRAICYSSSLTNTSASSGTTNPINCMSAITLPIYSNALDQSNWSFAVAPFAYGTVPQFVTLTPDP